MVRYYLCGLVKVVGSRTYALGNKGKYEWDFYHDYEDAIVPENECTKEEALNNYIEVNGTDEGFYDYE